MPTQGSRVDTISFHRCAKKQMKKHRLYLRSTSFNVCCGVRMS